MNSPHQREQLPALLCDALDPAERARVESHLAGCAQCQNELRVLQLMQVTAASLPMVPAPKNLRAGVLEALRDNGKQARALPVINVPGLARADKRGGSEARPNGKAPLLPFALPARSLAWGGAVALGAIGLMLLARPAMRNSPFETQAARSEADFASNASSADAEALSANDASGNDATSDNTNSDALTGDVAASQEAKDSAAPNGPKTAKSKANARTQAPVTSGGGALGDDSQLPPLPPPPTADQPAKPFPQPEKLAPNPSAAAPSFDLFPPLAPPPKTTARPPKTTVRPGAPAKVAPPVVTQTPKQSAPAAKAAPPKQSAPAVKNAPATEAAPSQRSAPATQAAPKSKGASAAAQSAPPAQPPAKTTRPGERFATAEAEPNQRADEASEFASNDTAPQPPAPAPAGSALGRSAPAPAERAPARPAPSRIAPAPAPAAGGESGGFAGGSMSESADAPDTSARVPVKSAQAPQNKAAQMPQSKAPQTTQSKGTDRNGSSVWPGGRVSAILKRRDSAGATAPLVLTLRVAKAVGYARLYLTTPGGERQVWRGSLNAAPVQIELSNAKLRGLAPRRGQTIRARLEQIDGFGNPMSDTTFDLVWP